MTIWIGWLQWTRTNGYQVDSEPILRSLENVSNRDAILDISDPDNPREPEWPESEFIIGNPPFSGVNRIRSLLPDEYVDKLYSMYADRLSAASDLCVYWFEKARRQIADGRCRRVGFIATQAIRGGVSREVLTRIKKTGEIFFAISDRDWVQEGVNAHVSMVGFDCGEEKSRVWTTFPF